MKIWPFEGYPQVVPFAFPVPARTETTLRRVRRPEDLTWRQALHMGVANLLLSIREGKPVEVLSGSIEFRCYGASDRMRFWSGMGCPDGVTRWGCFGKPPPFTYMVAPNDAGRDMVAQMEHAMQATRAGTRFWVVSEPGGSAYFGWDRTDSTRRQLLELTAQNVVRYHPDSYISSLELAHRSDPRSER